MTKIGVIGSGYVATVSSVCLAGMGHNIKFTMLHEERRAILKAGKIPFYEQGLDALLSTEVERGNLQFTDTVQEAIADVDIIYLCVGAPSLPNGGADLKPLEDALQLMAEGLAQHDGPITLVACSTLPAQTTHWIQERLETFIKQHNNKQPELHMACVPHFLREGQAVNDFYNPDRIILGSASELVTDKLVNLYSPLGAPIFITDILSAELIKLGTNAFLGMKISFINSMGQLCEKLGADVTQVAKGMGMDKRISEAFLNAGIGYGGVFFPRDIQSLIRVAEKHHLSLDLLKGTDVINRYQRIHFMDQMVSAMGGTLHGKTVAVWGLAYRPNTDDMRDAPSTQIVWGLQNRGATIRAYDPLAMDNAKSKLRNVTFCNDVYEAAEGADVIAILTEWPEFRQVSFKKLKEVTHSRLLVDGRNMYNPWRMKELGFTYISVGRPKVQGEEG